ncbi:hypothetical protein [Bacillus inaquosorum]|uniref:hypothetical protein n=1 Tax=Bacillus inaquosorum TaxID=483913 RepID=UPI00227E62B4|nr:hypothetical protein [Bacillus inaquosorum]MCY7961609.1 hypothetical protein [Bacillus inaquosorum]
MKISRQHFYSDRTAKRLTVCLVRESGVYKEKQPLVLINNKTLIGIAFQGFYILTIVEEIRLFI